MKPVTKEEKLGVTLQIQTMKAVDDLLCDFVEAKYHGYVDIWPVIKVKKKTTILEVTSKKVSSGTAPLTNKDCFRYEIVPGKGCKLVHS